MNVSIRPYLSDDHQSVLELIRVNIPEYFAVNEEKEFATYLDGGIEDYFVVEEAGRIIGCGGINYAPEQKEAIISWDMIHPDHHGKGIGRKLLQYRLHKIRQSGQFATIRVRTSQLAQGFYERAGFKLDQIKANYWGKGLDLYDMSQDT